MVDSKLDKYLPYSGWRSLQAKVADFIYRNLAQGKAIFVEAPTGVGKTAAALAATLAYSEGEDLKVVYMVRTNNQAALPMRELSRLFKDKGIFIPYIVVMNRARMCCISSTSKLPYRDFLNECNYLKRTGQCSFHNKLRAEGIDPSRFMESVAGLESWRSYIRSICGLGVCSYDASRSMASEAKVIILSYYYLFSLDAPEVVDLDLKSTILIVDEAHNLPYAILDMNTQWLSESMVKSAIVDVKKYVADPEVKANALRALMGIRSLFRELFTFDRQGEYRVDAGKVLEYFNNIDYLAYAAEEVLSSKRSRGLILAGTYIGDIVDFYKSIIRMPRDRMLFLTLSNDGKAIVSRLMDPSVAGSRVFNGIYGVVAMSGTMPPTRLFAKMLGINLSIAELRIPLTEYVKGDNVRTVVYSGVTSRYNERSEQLFAKTAEILCGMYDRVPRSVLAVFPSYDMLKAVRKYVRQSVSVIAEISTTTIDEVLEGLKQNPHRLIMVVAGGKLAEGIELRVGNVNYVDAIAIVGVPYPEPNDFTNSLVDVMRVRVGEDDAWHIVFTWNAVVKVKQAIGRGLRSENDRVFIALLDYRFRDNPVIWRELRSYLPNLNTIDDEDELFSQLSSFINSNLD